MAAKKARKSKKAPSAKQIAARKKFVAAVKAGKFKKAAKAKRGPTKWRASKKRKPAKSVTRKSNSHEQIKTLNGWGLWKVSDAYGTAYYVNKLNTPATQQRRFSNKAEALAYLKKMATVQANPKKRNGKTIIKAKRVTILNLKKNPAFAIHKTLKPTKRGNQAGWLLGTKFYAKSRGQKALPGGSVLDLNSGLVYQRVENPKGRPVGKGTQALRAKLVKALDAAQDSGRITDAQADRLFQLILDGWPMIEDNSRRQQEARKRAVEAFRWQGMLRKANPRKKNIAGFMQDGVFHPIRSGVEQRTTKSGVRRVKSKKAYKPSKVGEKRTYSAKKAAKRGVQSRRMAAATKQRKATTTRLASRSLDRSGPKKTKRNPIYNYVSIIANARRVASLIPASSAAKLRKAATRLEAVNRQIEANLYTSDRVMLDKLFDRADRIAKPLSAATDREDGKQALGGYRKKTRRNPSVEQKLQEWRGTPKDRDSVLIAPDGTPSPLYQLGPLQDLRVEGYSAKDFRIEKPGVIWVCADAKGKIHFATKSGVPMTNLPAGPIGKVKRIDYGPVHKTQFYDKAEEFKHNFGEENGKRPTLYSDGKGGLLLKGGDYYITYRGIQN